MSTAPEGRGGDEREQRVRARLDAADADVARFRGETGLACPAGCGACCLSPEVEASAAECAPLAAALVGEGRAGAVLADLARAAAEGQGRCVLYLPDAADERRGRCSAYPARPLVCRLYGFAGRLRRDGAAELAACRTMSAADPVRTEAARGAIAAGLPVPLFADHARALVADEPGEAGRLLPINAALAGALERELLLERLRAAAGRAPALQAPPPADGPTPDGPPGPRPLHPRRAA